MGNNETDKAESAEKAPKSVPTKERKGVKRMTMNPRKGGTRTKGKGDAKDN